MPSDGPGNAAIQAICAEGLAAHQAGRLEEAARLYEQVLAGDPDHADALHLLGVVHIQTRRLEPAVELIRRAVAARPDFVDAYGNLANALNALGRAEEALVASDRGIALRPDYAQAHGNRGQALQALGRRDDAMASYERVVALQPTAQAHYNRATLLRDLGRLEEAVDSYGQVIALKPDYAAAYRSRGITLADLGRLEAALADHSHAIALNPAYAEAHFSQGVALRELARPSEALASFDRAIALKADYAEAFGNRANALHDLKRYDEALADYDQATRLNPSYIEALSNRVAPLRMLRRPDAALAASDEAIAAKSDYAEAHNHRGGALYDLRRLDEALESYDRAVALKPDYAEAHNNRGVVLFELRRLADAAEAYDRALAAEPLHAEGQHNQAMCRLALGDFAQGWAQYEWRWRSDQFAAAVRDLGAPLWLGEEDLAGRSLLLHSEQGLGDTLQFCRYVTAVADLGAKVILEIQPALGRLLCCVEGVAQIVTVGEALPRCDFQTPLMSLPLALGGAGPAPLGPYLSADPEAVAAWAGRLEASDGRRIGLCWAGGARAEEMAQNSIDQRRSLPLEAFAPLADVEGATFYSLQKGPPTDQLADAVARGWAGPPIIDLTAELKDFADTAALVANLDLVITCDTAVAHLAGGLGKPVWILNRFDTCWRWLDGRADSPWYPTARLFTQPAPGDWASVVKEVRRELAGYAPGGRTMGKTP